MEGQRKEGRQVCRNEGRKKTYKSSTLPCDLECRGFAVPLPPHEAEVLMSTGLPRVPLKGCVVSDLAPRFRDEEVPWVYE